MMAVGMWLTLFALHALWQVPLLWAAGLLVRRTASQARPVLQYRLWVTVLCAQVVLPAISASGFNWRGVLRALEAWCQASGARGGLDSVTTSIGPVLVDSRRAIPAQIWIPLLCLFVSVTGVYAMRFGYSYWRVRQLRFQASAADLPEVCLAEWRASCERFGLKMPALLETEQPIGIVTVGWHNQALVAPAGLLQQLSPQDRLAAFAHECAHMRRNDFAWNFVWQLIALPLRFHPLTRYTLLGIAEAREMVCDELAAAVVAGRRTYLESLLRLAAQLLAAGSVGNFSAIGMLDANLLERRLMRLEQNTHLLRRPAVVAMALTAVVSLAGTWATASALRLAVAGPGKSVPSASTTPVHVDSSVEAGNSLSKVPPVYPQNARDAHITGSVVLKAVIDESGKIAHLEVLSGPAELTKSALDAVSQWTYTPYLLKGQPTSVDTTITVNYNLNSQAWRSSRVARPPRFRR